jgi:PPIC-type PPIASE domain
VAAKRATGLLAAGALAGLVAASAGLLIGAPHGSALPSGAVATVNGTVVRTVEYERALEALASDRRTPLGDADRRHVLDRLVDEELLVQRGVELGLVQHDRRVRGDLVSAVIDSVVADADDGGEPSPQELRDFYSANRDYFTRAGRVRARQLWVAQASGRSDGEARDRAAEAARRLRGGDSFEEVAASLGDPAVVSLPDALLPATKLVEYVGPGATAAALALPPGQPSDPLPAPGGYRVLEVVEREPAAPPPFEAIQDEVRAEWRRRAGDRALERYLEELRARARIDLAAGLP